MENKILKLLGLIYRANKILIGDQNIYNHNKVKYMFIASDASINTQKRYEIISSKNNFDINKQFSSVQLSNSIGKNNIKVIGIIDNGFKKIILNNINK